MKSKILLVVFFLFFFAANANSSPQINTDEFSFKIPNSLKAVNKKGAFLKTDKNGCVRLISVTTHKYAGEICVSKNDKLFVNAGIVPYESIPESSRNSEKPSSGMVLTTALSQYPLEKFIEKEMHVFSTISDCDEEDGAIYRATSSCHVAIANFDNKFIYSYFVIKNNVTRQTNLTIDDIKYIWNSISFKKK
jgi:hypothetical protein